MANKIGAKNSIVLFSCKIFQSLFFNKQYNGSVTNNKEVAKMFFQQDSYLTDNRELGEQDVNYIYALGYAMICNEMGK